MKPFRCLKPGSITCLGEDANVPAGYIVAGVKTTVSIVEDDRAIRELLAQWLNDAPEFTCVSSHENAEDALNQLPQMRPAIVLTDINLPGATGVELVAQLKSTLPKTQFLMLTVYADTEHILQAL